MKLKLFLILLFCFKITLSQNLVPNGSFELFLDCPDAGAQIYKSIGWFQPVKNFGLNVNISSSSDYFNSCSLNSDISVPNNGAGIQFAKTGIAYAGIGLALQDGTDYREYIATSLTQPLIKGRTYEVSFEINLADLSSIASNSIGVYFSQDSIFSTNFNHINFIPQIESNGVFIDNQTDWLQINRSFVAHGFEKFLLLGNFKDSSSIQIKLINGLNPIKGAYYYIDDVSVICLDCDSAEQKDSSNLVMPNIFSPNNDGVNDVFIATAKNIVSYSCILYNRYGQQITQLNQINAAWDGHTQSGIAVCDGVYYYLVTAMGADGIEHKLKGFVTLLR